MSASRDLLNDLPTTPVKPASSTQTMRGSTAAENVKGALANALHTAAQSLHRTTERGTQNSRMAAYGGQAADWLDRSAEYVRDMNAQQVKSDIVNQARRHPGRTLLIAGAVGLLLGRLMRR